MPRAAFYIDGFNLYHSIDELGQQHLKWCNYWRLSELIMDPADTLIEVVVGTAYYPNFNKKKRHEAHVAALKNVGVDVRIGHYVYEDMECLGSDCGRKWQKPTEKEGDINVALAVLDGAHRNIFDRAYLITADSDQAATAKLFAQRFPEKQLISVSPPGRTHSKHILGHLPHPKSNLSLGESHVDLACFAHVVPSQTGGRAVSRPREYDPPVGWVHPNDRPSKKGR